MISTGRSSGRTQPCLTRWWYSSAHWSVSCLHGGYPCWTERGATRRKKREKRDIKWRLDSTVKGVMAVGRAREGKRGWDSVIQAKKLPKIRWEWKMRERQSGKVIGNCGREIVVWDDNWRLLQCTGGCVSLLHICCESLPWSRRSCTQHELSSLTLPGLTFACWLIYNNRHSLRLQPYIYKYTMSHKGSSMQTTHFHTYKVRHIVNSENIQTPLISSLM